MQGYLGSKGGAGVWQTIVNRMPPHRVYIEPFLGGGAVLRHKRPAAHNIGVDRDDQVVAWWRDQGLGEAFEFRQGDAVAFLAAYPWRGDELVYCDPPYLVETRRSAARYRCELDLVDHKRLLDVLDLVPARVMLSGYASDLYRERLAGWHSHGFPAMTRGGLAIECLWCNFEPPAALHDYRVAGRDFRERERIKRKARRWVEGLARMPELERRAVLAAIEAAWPDLVGDDSGIGASGGEDLPAE